MPRGHYKRKPKDVVEFEAAPVAVNDDTIIDNVNLLNGLWKEAWDRYHDECHGDLSLAPEWVKQQYKDQARETFIAQLKG